ncbi:MAG: hypothetical protein JNG86_22925, partial [Verrucomicrobiaceae bacterium]|nr:hypothetical protein [Verrucomicrobiaceae bacterium]
MNRRHVSRRFLPLFTLLALLGAVPARAVTDNFSTGPGQGAQDGLCDVWQTIYNGWGLALGDDEDNDGCTNLVESIAGTNPRVAGDCLKVGSTVVGATTVTFFFDSEGGKKYEVVANTSVAGTYSPVNITSVNGVAQTPAIAAYVPPADSPAGVPTFVTVTRAAGTTQFYKLRVSDTDSNGDTLSDWAAVELGFDPADVDGDTDNDGVSDNAVVNAEVAVPNTVSISATESLASEDGPAAGSFTVTRSHGLLGATVNFSLAGTASAPGDYSASPGTSVVFAPGEKSKVIHVNPAVDAEVEGSESVTATLTTASAGSYAAPTIDPDHDEATVIIGNTTAASGTGLMARYYDHSSSIYVHAANFGDSANYQYTRAGTTPNFTGSAVVTPTGVSPTRLAQLLAALTPNTTQVKFSFNGGNLNTAVYNHQNFLVTAKTAATFTIALPSGAGLPGNSTSTCFFSIQPIHPGLIERLETVNNDWIYGTPNAVTITHLNSPDNYSETFETYLVPSVAGSYRFQLDADDKARVLIDLNLNGTFDLPGEQVVEHGWDTAATGSPEDGTADDEVVGTFKATPAGSPYTLAVPTTPAERYKMRVEHVDATGDARCRLQWSVNGAAFANIPQANQLTHTQAMNWSYTAGNLTVTPTGGHTRAVNDFVDLSFSSGPLFRPGATSTQNGTLQISAVNGTTTFTVPIPPTSVTLNGCATTTGSATVSVPSVTGLYLGMSVLGTGIPANAVINVIGTTTITLSANATATGTANLTCRLGGIPITIAGASTTA